MFHELLRGVHEVFKPELGMGDGLRNQSVAAATGCVGDAVGVPGSVDDPRKWFVAVVSNNTERASRDRLSALGHEAYVPCQRETRVWGDGRRREVERVVTPSLLFVRATEPERRVIVGYPFISRFLTDRARRKTATGPSPVAVIPASQMLMLRFMVGASDRPVTFDSRPARAGDRVRVIRGHLRGLEGVVLRDEGTCVDPTVCVNLSLLGCARVSVPTLDLELIPI